MKIAGKKKYNVYKWKGAYATTSPLHPFTYKHVYIGICAPCSIMLRKGKIKHLVVSVGFNRSMEDEWMFAGIKPSSKLLSPHIFPHSSAFYNRPCFQHDVIQFKFKLLRINSFKLHFVSPICKIQTKLQSLCHIQCKLLLNFQFSCDSTTLSFKTSFVFVLFLFFSNKTTLENLYCN